MEIYVLKFSGGEWEDYFEEKEVFVGPVGRQTAEARYKELVDEYFGVECITLSHGVIAEDGQVYIGETISETIR